jgi:sRNA-binding protein
MTQAKLCPDAGSAAPGLGSKCSAVGEPVERPRFSALYQKSQGVRPRTPDEVIAGWAARYPQASFVDPGQRKPLKVGVFYDLDGRPEDRSEALREYVGHRAYLKKCAVAGAHRINLEGEPAGTVSHDEAVYALLILNG